MLSDGTILPETVCIMAAAAAAWFLFSLTSRFFPPAAAIAVLPFLLPSEGLWKYPLEILAGISLFYAAARIVSAWDHKLSGMDVVLEQKRKQDEKL